MKESIELRWMSEHSKELGKHAGKWIAVLDNKILAKGNSISEIKKEIERMKIKKLPLITKIPRKGEEMSIL